MNRIAASPALDNGDLFTCSCNFPMKDSSFQWMDLDFTLNSKCTQREEEDREDQRKLAVIHAGWSSKCVCGVSTRTEHFVKVRVECRVADRTQLPGPVFALSQSSVDFYFLHSESITKWDVGNPFRVSRNLRECLGLVSITWQNQIVWSSCPAGHSSRAIIPILGAICCCYVIHRSSCTVRKVRINLSSAYNATILIHWPLKL